MTQFALAGLYKASEASQVLIPTLRQLDGASNFEFVGIQARSGRLVDFKFGEFNGFKPVYPTELSGDIGYHSLIQLGDFGFICVETNPGYVQTVLWPNLEKKWQEELSKSLNDFSSYLIRKLFDENALSKSAKLGANIKGWRAAEYVGQRTLDRTWKKVELPLSDQPTSESEETFLSAYRSRFSMLKRLNHLNSFDYLNDHQMLEWRVLFSNLWETRYDTETVLDLASSQIIKHEIGDPQFQYIFDAVSGFLNHYSFRDAVYYILDEMIDDEHRENHKLDIGRVSTSLAEADSRLASLRRSIRVLFKILESQIPNKTNQNSYDIGDIISALFVEGLGEVENDENIDIFSPEHTIIRIIDFIPLLEKDIDLWRSTIERTASAIDGADLRKERRAYLLRQLMAAISLPGMESLVYSTASAIERERLRKLSQHVQEYLVENL